MITTYNITYNLHTKMSTDEEIKKLLVAESVDVDDNKLVTRDDIKHTETKTTTTTTALWSDPDRLSKLQKEMQSLSKIRITTEKFPEDVLLKAMADVLSEVGWYNYAEFNRSVNLILTGKSGSVPFSTKTRDLRTGKMDFWLVRVFLYVDEKSYEFEGKMYSKLEVLMSQQFCMYLRGFCKTQLKDEAQFWSFTGSYVGKQHLDVTRFSQSYMTILTKQFGEVVNPDNLVMIQWKKKTPETMVGRN
jgi:hypothetical protein